MPDPLDDLREPIVPVHPDPAFASDLRRRIVQALRGPTGGGAMPTTTATPSRYRTLTPMIAVVDAHRALAWYEEVFAARRGGDFHLYDDGTIGHAELEIGDAILMLGEDREPGSKAPASSIFVQVADADATVALAVARGAELERPVADEPYGRTGVVIDPFRQRWIVSMPPPGVYLPASGPRHGELGYVTIRVPDVERARRFYGAVLGWTFEPGADRRPPRVAVWGEVDAPAVDLLFRVDDLDAALGRVRAHGGQAEEPARERFGRVARCADDQGGQFQLWEATSLT
jgi:predicted enzyme related to lactoylglutathione lyase